MNDKVKEVLGKILAQFESGQIPECVAFTCFTQNIPSDHWSFLNRIIMYASGTGDARGFRQWLEAKRFVKKGTKAIYILAPLLVKSKEDPEKKVLIGFKSVPVFRAEDTEGEPLKQEEVIAQFPLIERAKQWGINVRTIRFDGAIYGAFSQTTGTIALATEDECVFFHELAHSADHRLKGKLKGGQDPYQEIVAELSAHALCRLVGKSGEKHLGNTHRYIKGYAEKLGKSPLTACMEVLEQVEKVIKLIMKGGDHAQETPEADKGEAIEAAARSVSD